MILAIIALAMLSPADARDDGERYDVRRFTCPVGGERFEQDVGYYAFPLITLPDGSWLGDHAIDAQIPACPGNGLVILPDYDEMARQGAQRMVYHSYTPAELARLPGLIADPAYAALRPEGRHAQAYWLATALGRPAQQRFYLLQRAGWAATSPTIRRRLVERLVADGPALIDAAALTETEKRFLTSYIVNGLRELGRFDEALALLESLERGGPAVLEPDDPDSMYGPAALAPKMRLAIAARDDGRFPIELLPARIVGDICDGSLPPPYNQRTAATAGACEARRQREAREAAETEATIAASEALLQDRAALDAHCAATPTDRRDRALAWACDERELERAGLD